MENFGKFYSLVLAAGNKSVLSIILFMKLNFKAAERIFIVDFIMTNLLIFFNVRADKSL